MTKVVFCFAGTGDRAAGYFRRREQSMFNKDVVRIYINGCQESNVGGGILFPDLDLGANNIRNAFSGNTLDVDQLKKNLGSGLYRINGAAAYGNITVDEITLEGFSRGAVSTFATAQKLDELDIPMHIIANQPVPGETGIANGLHTKYGDLSHCKNIKSAYTFLASYDNNQGAIHNHFFKQMLAKFAPNVDAQHFLFPHQRHLEWFKSSPIDHHFTKLLAERGYIFPENDEQCIKQWYCRDNYAFTPHELMQPILVAHGPIPLDPVYVTLNVEQASFNLKRFGLAKTNHLDFEKADAICELSYLYWRPEQQPKLKELLSFILQDTKGSQQFVKIVNKSSGLCGYLVHSTAKTGGHLKSNAIKEHSLAYRESIFDASYKFLSKARHSTQEKLDYADELYQAELKFRKNALGINRSAALAILMILTNFITHTTGIALIVNSVNKAQTGNWLLFKHNRSTNAVKQVRENILSDVDKIDVGENKPTF